MIGVTEGGRDLCCGEAAVLEELDLMEHLVAIERLDVTRLRRC
jgi:hypothetical protein